MVKEEKEMMAKSISPRDGLICRERVTRHLRLVKTRVTRRLSFFSGTIIRTTRVLSIRRYFTGESCCCVYDAAKQILVHNQPQSVTNAGLHQASAAILARSPGGKAFKIFI